MNDEYTNIVDGYQLVSLIANGSASQIWEVEEQGTSRRYAMKLLQSDNEQFKEHKANLKNETDVGKALSHPNIIRVDKFSGGRDHVYMIMEYFRAINVKLQIKGELPLLQSRMRALVDGMCAGLSHIHDRGWVHRDFKPDNVLMNAGGEVKLIDFSLASKITTGFAKLLSGAPRAIQGTRTYIAPETIRKQTATPQTDMYSLGITLFELLTGKTPFGANTPEELLRRHLSARPPNPSQFNPNVTPEMDKVVARLLLKRPEERHKDMGELIGELRRIRFFHEDVVAPTYKKEEATQDQADLLDDLAGKIDSRGDVRRQELMRQDPELARQVEAKRATAAAKKKETVNQTLANRPATNVLPNAPHPIPTVPTPAPAAAAHSATTPAPTYSQPGYPLATSYGMPAGMYPPGMYPSGVHPQGMQPPGMLPPTMIPGYYPPPAMRPPGMLPPTMIPAAGPTNSPNPQSPAIMPAAFPPPTQPTPAIIPPANVSRPVVSNPAATPSATPVSSAPPAGPPVAPRSPAPSKAPSPAPSKPPVAPPPPVSPDQLEVMTELPDVL